MVTKNTNKTYLPKEKDIERKFYLIDAKDKVLGKVATKAAVILRGKHKAIYTPHLDTGDQVIIINAEKIRVTGKKMQQKEYQRYSGYPSGQRRVSLEEMLKRAPSKVLEHAIGNMIPKGRLGNKIRSRIKVYAGETHPHTSQKPIPLEI